MLTNEQNQQIEQSGLSAADKLAARVAIASLELIELASAQTGVGPSELSARHIISALKNPPSATVEG